MKSYQNQEYSFFPSELNQTETSKCKTRQMANENRHSQSQHSNGWRCLKSVALATYLNQLVRVCTAGPVVTAGTPVCNDGWFHGYQSLGITFTIGDSNADSFVIGGSVPSGCSVLDATQVYFQDKCALIQYFATQSQTSPTQSFILGSFSMQSGAKIGITGILALAKAKIQGETSFSGLLQLGSGVDYSSMPSTYTPDGTELAIFSFTGATNSVLKYFYLPNYFRSSNCKVGKNTIDYASSSFSLTIAFQSCNSPLDNFVAQIVPSSGTLKSLTKFSNTQLKQWYTVSNDGVGDSAFLTGMANSPTQTLTWLISQSSQMASSVSSPKCKYNLAFNSNWQAEITSRPLFPAFAKLASNQASAKEGVVVLHNPGFFNGFALIVTWESPCTSNFDAYTGLSKFSTDIVTVKDMQLYYNTADSGTGVKLLISVNSDYYLLTDIVNDRQHGWNQQARSPEVHKLSFQFLSQNPLFPGLNSWGIDISTAFMFKDSSKLVAPVIFGKTNKYWQTVNDGFMWRKNTNSCVNFKLTQESASDSQFHDDEGERCIYKPSVTSTHSYVNPTFNCGSGTQVTSAASGTSLIADLNVYTYSGVSKWLTTASYTVKNPCMMSITATTPANPLNRQLGIQPSLIALTPTIKDNCPYSSYTVSSLKLDYSLISVINQITSSPTLQIASYSAPSLTAAPYSYNYLLMLVTDYSLVGTYQATFQFTIQGDSNSVVYSDTSTYLTPTIVIKGCSPATSFPPVLASVTVLIGTPQTINLFSPFQNGDCAYSTAADDSVFWQPISVYTKEVLALSGTVLVQTTNSNPTLKIDTIDQTKAGTHTYTYRYTDYKGVVIEMSQTIVLQATACISGVTGLGTVVGPYSHSIISATALTIDVSTVQNYQCGYQFALQQQSGPQTSNFMSLTQPTFITSSGFIKAISTQGALSVSVFTGAIVDRQQFVGSYMFKLVVNDQDAPFIQRASVTFQVEIENCQNEWNPSLNLTKVDYVLSQTTKVDIPSFVNTSQSICNQVTTTFKTASLLDLSTAITLVQNSSTLGTAQLTLSTNDPNLRGSQTLILTCSDAFGGSQNFYMALTIKHMCDDSVITTFSNFDQTVKLSNSSDQMIQVPFFTKNIDGCDLVYNVSYQLVSGPITTDLLSLDLLSLVLTISSPAEPITLSSTVKVTISAQTLGLTWLPSKETSFKLNLVPMISQNTTLATNKSSNQTSLNTTITEQSNKTNTSAQFQITFKPNQTETKIDKTPLIPTIVSISESGEVKIKFNRNLIIPSMYTNVSMRRMEPGYVERVDECLRLYVKSGIDDYDKNRTKIVMTNLTDFQRSHITLQVEFLDPDHLSPSYIQPDMLYVKFILPLIFVSETQVYLDDQTIISKAIPTQLSKSQALKVAQLAATVSSGMNTIAATNLIVNIVLSFGLKYLWNFVNLLQFLVFIPRWQIKIPLNALAVLQQLKSIALMEFIPTKQITGTISGWLAMDPDDDSNIMNSMGLMLLVALMLLIVVAVLGIASYFVQNSYSAYKTYRQIRESIFYNSFLRYMLQSVLKVGLASATTLQIISWGNFKPSMAISVITSSLTLLVFGLSPLFFGLILKRNFANLSRPSTHKAIGTIYLSIKDTDKMALAYAPFFMFRRLLFIAITFGMVNQPGLQIHFFTFVSLLYIMFLGLVVPHDILQLTESELVNESMLMISCYHFILFTGVVDDVQTRTNLGWSLVAFIGLLLAFNISVILHANFIELKRKYTLWRLKKTAREAQNAKISRKIQAKSRHIVGSLESMIFEKKTPTKPTQVKTKGFSSGVNNKKVRQSVSTRGIEEANQSRQQQVAEELWVDDYSYRSSKLNPVNTRHPFNQTQLATEERRELGMHSVIEQQIEKIKRRQPQVMQDQLVFKQSFPPKTKPNSEPQLQLQKPSKKMSAEQQRRQVIEDTKALVEQRLSAIDRIVKNSNKSQMYNSFL